MDNIKLIAIDIAKSIFHVRAVNHCGKAIYDKKVRREKLFDTVLSLSDKATIAMESCATSHYWGRRFQSQGYTVKLIAPQFVKPYVKSHKNDRADAEAIAEAASRASMRYVEIKTAEQQSLQFVHRIRTRLIGNRTALMNEARAILSEFGYITAKGKASLKRFIVCTLNKQDTEFPDAAKKLVSNLYEEICDIDERIVIYDKQLKSLAKSDPTCQKLQTIHGIGYVAATALLGSFGKAKQFKNGRSLAASVGLVPDQHSSGGKERLGRITKKGDGYIRQLLVHGGRAVLRTAHQHKDPYRLWATKLRNLKGYNKASVALANRNARIAWVILSKGEVFSAEKSCAVISD